MSLISRRTYAYDTLGIPTARSSNRQGTTRNDAFTHNDRQELTAATLGADNYAYAYDNIGNRKTAQEVTEEVTQYNANNLNQYTAIDEFVPTYDADGNQTKIQTSTGIWNVTYNALNRPVLFTSADGATSVECSYDYMGRRCTKKVTVNGEVTLHQRYLYRGYLQIACVDLTRSAHPSLWLILWDPTQPVATRPLAIQKDGTWYTYGRDLTKNICEVFGPAGYIRTTYGYTPFGSVTANGDVTQPIQWSSEFDDEELGLVYYNYRHYNPRDGRWINRDLIGERGGMNLYGFVRNGVGIDIKGLQQNCCGPDITEWFRQELIYLVRLIRKKARNVNKISFEISYYKWLKDNGLKIRYKDRDFDPKNACNSQEDCINSVTLGEYCIDRSELGNIVFGFLAGYVRMPIRGMILGFLKLGKNKPLEAPNNPADAGGIAVGYYIIYYGGLYGINIDPMLTEQNWLSTLKKSNIPYCSDEVIREYISEQFTENIEKIYIPGFQKPWQSMKKNCKKCNVVYNGPEYISEKLK